jgi:hypothetical protein
MFIVDKQFKEVYSVVSVSLKDSQSIEVNCLVMGGGMPQPIKQVRYVKANLNPQNVQSGTVIEDEDYRLVF